MNDSGDLLDLQSAVNPTARPNINKMKKHELDSYLLKTTHCSALVKVIFLKCVSFYFINIILKILPGFENIFMAHSSWFTYQAMLRIFKHYDFNLDDTYTMAKAVSFSSYPGFYF